MKAIAAILVILCFLVVAWPQDLSGQDMGGASSTGQGLAVKWLGNAGWEIQIGQTIVLIDPFLTRGEASPNAEWKTDEAAVLNAIKRADYIFAAHSHADHIADIPIIAKKFGSKVIGSRTTTRLLHQNTGGFIEDKLTGLKVDTALLYPMENGDLLKMLELLQPKTVFLHHFDRLQLPFADGLPDATLGRGRRFARDVSSIDKKIKVIVPKFFESHTVE